MKYQGTYDLAILASELEEAIKKGEWRKPVEEIKNLIRCKPFTY
jgi:hypothetical protein